MKRPGLLERTDSRRLPERPTERPPPRVGSGRFRTREGRARLGPPGQGSAGRRLGGTLTRTGSDSRQRAAAATAGLAAAALFGASAPLAKLLIPGTGPLVLAGLLYLGAGAGLSALASLRRKGAEAPLRAADAPTLTGMIVAGGLAGPVLLVVGLSRLSGVSASLLLNLEAPLTIALAVLAFGDHLTRGEGLGAGAVVLGAAALAWAPGAIRLDAGGIAAVVGACAAWALDNNLSQRLALRDPVAVARVKTLAAGLVNTTLGLALGEHVPPARYAAAALAVGYGLSIVLHLLAVRGMGAARQAALFAAAPFIGAVVAVPVLGERLGASDLVAGAVMAGGIAILLRARHEHVHVHEALEHEHAHVHDDHHRHEHADQVAEPHSHPHAHPPLLHDHPHLPDVQKRRVRVRMGVWLGDLVSVLVAV